MGRPKTILYSEQEKISVLDILERRRENANGRGKYKRNQLKDITFNFKITPVLYAKMVRIAKSEQKNRSEFARYCIEFYCDLKELDGGNRSND